MAVRNDFTAGEVLAAADLNDTFASKVDYALPVNAQTGTTYTFVAADAEKLTTASNAAAVTLTIPPQSSVTWSDNTVLRVVNYGAGAVTIDGGSGVTVTNTATTLAQFQSAVAIRTGSDAWTLVPFAGGGVGNADFSNTATGTYTDSGIDYKYVTFAASGTLTVTQEGYADILVVGGGGGGANNGNQAGGGGGDVQYGAFMLSAQNYTVTVGAAGSGANAANAAGGTGGTSSLGSVVVAGGGGGGYAFGIGSGNFSAAGVGGGGSGGGVQINSGANANGGGAGSGTAGKSISISGASVAYAAGGTSSASTVAGSGGWSTGNGRAGVVIVRVRTN